MKSTTPHTRFDVVLCPSSDTPRGRANTIMSRWWDRRALSCLPFMELTMTVGMTLCLCIWMALT